MKSPLLPVFLCLLFATSAIGQSLPFNNATKPNTWIIKAAEDFVVPAPPDAAGTSTEIKMITSLQKKIDTTAMKSIRHWDKGAASYQWQEMMWAIIDEDSTQNYLRVNSLVSVAIYDATVAAGLAKNKFQRTRPKSAQIIKHVNNPSSYSYPCEHSVTAGAAATMLAFLYPAKADSILKVGREAAQSRVLAGVQYPSDTEAGFELGAKIARYIIENRAKSDGWDKKWPGAVPVGPRYWKGKPLKADIPNVKPWVLQSNTQFHSAPPPDEANDMAEMKAYKANGSAKYRAFRWEYEFPWGTIVDRKLLEYHLSDNAVAVARVNALLAIADHDSQISNITSKYIYFRIRPDQYDTTYKALFKTPPTPGYPAGHATAAGCYETILSYLFPHDAQDFTRFANEEAESRFEGGVHFRSDNVAGMEMGRKVAQEIIKWAKSKDR